MKQFIKFTLCALCVSIVAGCNTNSSSIDPDAPLRLNMRVILDNELSLTAPDDISFECDELLNDAALAQWLSSASVSSTCSNAVVLNNFIGLSDDCGKTGSATVTWMATDDCDNMISHTAIFDVTDLASPSIDGPDDVTVDCDGSVTSQLLQEWLDSTIVTDDCGDVDLMRDDVRLSDGCADVGTTRATWTATDACGHEATHTAIFTIRNTEPLLVVESPGNTTVECDSLGNETAFDVWLADVSVVGGCGSESITHEISDLSIPCDGASNADVIWTATDACDETGSTTAVFSIVDTTAPMLTVPDDQIFCADNTDLSALGPWLASATAEDECSEVTIVNNYDREQLQGNCVFDVTWMATDHCGNQTMNSASADVQDSEPPAIVVNGSEMMILECNFDDYLEQGAKVMDACDVELTEARVGGDVVDISTPNVYVVSYSATDFCGNVATKASRTVEVEDTLPPFAPEGIAFEMWPPNHQYETHSLADCVRDLCEVDLDVNMAGQIVNIFSDEPENSNGDGNTTDDIIIIDNSSFMLRAERRGGSNGRVYGVTFDISDSAGNSTRDTCFISVPHDQSGAPAVNDGAESGYTVLP